MKNLALTTSTGYSTTDKNYAARPNCFLNSFMDTGRWLSGEEVSYCRTLDFAKIEENMDSKYYCEVFKQYLVGNTAPFCKGDWSLQRANAPMHLSIYIKQLLDAFGINFLDFPSRFSDMNIIENVWELFVRKVYSNKRQYNEAFSIQDAFMSAWNWLSTNYTDYDSL